ncbi:MAG: FMN-binding negative transcriptional regulator [Jatrophihabitantaceae bacterium]
MFVPSHYREPDSSWMLELICSNPLAMLVSNGNEADGPFATHLPVIPEPGANPQWQPNLAGAKLLGHLNRANPHWAALETGAVALLTFTGPHAYVSPTVYETTPAAPTWNFTSVHAHCVLEKIDSLEDTLDVVQHTVRTFEGAFGAGWDMSESLDYFRRIVPAVGAFKATVTRAEGMFKLSQEQPPDVFDRVQCSFAGRESNRHRETARLMSKLP